ncbi:MAG: potassium channel family protein [Paracoccaceae bacterium]
MVLQIALGTGLLLASILIAAASAWVMELAFERGHRWLMREPHRPKLFLMIAAISVWILAVITAGVWLWASAFLLLGVFPTLEEAVYFSTVTFTTLGFGDVLLPKEWRLLAGMAAANGLLNFGLLTALMVEALRHVRLGQMARRQSVRPPGAQPAEPHAHPKDPHPAAPEAPRPDADPAV